MDYSTDIIAFIYIKVLILESLKYQTPVFLDLQCELCENKEPLLAVGILIFIITYKHYIFYLASEFLFISPH